MRAQRTNHRSALTTLGMLLVLVLAGAGAAVAGLPSVPKPSAPPPPPPPPSGISVPAPPGNIPIPLPNFQLPNVPAPAMPQLHQTTGSITKAQRAVLVISAGLQKYAGRNSNSLEDRGWNAIYDFLQKSGSSLPEAQLSPLYDKVLILDASRGKVPATVDMVYSTLRDLSARYQTVDMIIHCHGRDGELWFEDGGFRIADFATALVQGGSLNVMDADGHLSTRTFQALPPASRQHLRMVLETACYGSSHKAEWRRAGFVAAAGATAIHADSWVSFPAFLNWWSQGYSFGEAVSAANNADPARLTDHAVSIFFPGKTVDSRRQTDGNMSVDLSTPTAPAAAVSPVQSRAGLPRPAAIRR